MSKKALLFINGKPPKQFPDLEDFGLIACTDGAFHYLKEKNFPLEKLDFISGDFDSHAAREEIEKLSNDYSFEIIFTPNQDLTDFHKALTIILDKGFEEVSVYGGSGGEQDHYLGNLHTAFVFKDQLKIIFFDEFSTYFFIPKHFTANQVQGKMISLVPFPSAENVTTKGLNWSFSYENISLTTRIGTRNFAKEDSIEISYETGTILLFIGR